MEMTTITEQRAVTAVTASKGRPSYQKFDEYFLLSNPTKELLVE